MEVCTLGFVVALSTALNGLEGTIQNQWKCTQYSEAPASVMIDMSPFHGKSYIGLDQWGNEYDVFVPPSADQLLKKIGVIEPIDPAAPKFGEWKVHLGPTFGTPDPLRYYDPLEIRPISPFSDNWGIIDPAEGFEINPFTGLAINVSGIAKEPRPGPTLDNARKGGPYYPISLARLPYELEVARTSTVLALAQLRSDWLVAEQLGSIILAPVPIIGGQLWDIVRYSVSGNPKYMLNLMGDAFSVVDDLQWVVPENVKRRSDESLAEAKQAHDEAERRLDQYDTEKAWRDVNTSHEPDWIDDSRLVPEEDGGFTLPPEHRPEGFDNVS